MSAGGVGGLLGSPVDTSPRHSPTDNNGGMGGSGSGLRQRATHATDDPDTTAPLRQQVETIVRKLKVLDVYPKMEEEYSVQTNLGGAISIVSGIIILMLFLSELGAYMSVITTEHIKVDTRSGQKLQINFNITFPQLRCSQVRLDVMDVSGESQVDASDHTYRQRHDRFGANIGESYLDIHDGHAPLDQAGEGCTTWGNIEVNKVAGNVHIALGSSHKRDDTRHVHQFMIQDMQSFNASHTINYLSFGKLFPGVVNPLDGVARMATEGPAHFQYFVKVVPTTFVATTGHIINTNQFSVTEQTHVISFANPSQVDTHKIPGVFIIYDISPFMVQVEASGMPFSRFMTSLCAIIGGVFTIAGLIDSLLYHGDQYMKRQGRNTSE